MTSKIEKTMGREEVKTEKKDQPKAKGRAKEVRRLLQRYVDEWG